MGSELAAKVLSSPGRLDGYKRQSLVEVRRPDSVGRFGDRSQRLPRNLSLWRPGLLRSPLKYTSRQGTLWRSYR